MIKYGLAALGAQVAIVFGWCVSIFIFKDAFEGTVGYVAVNLVFYGGIPILVQTIANPLIFRILKNLSFSIVLPASLCCYIVVCEIYLDRVLPMGASYTDPTILMFFWASLIPVIGNLVLFWRLGIRSNNYFQGNEIQHWWAGAT